MIKFVNVCFFAILSVTTVLSQEISTASGGTARNIALGGGPENPYIDDVLRVHINPALALRYANYVWGDIGFFATDAPLGSGKSQYVGVQIGLNDRIALGLLLNKRESPLYNSDPANPELDPIMAMNGRVAVLGSGAPPFSRPLSPIELLVALEKEGRLFGFSMTMAGWSSERMTSSGTVNQSSRSTRFKIGTSFNILPELRIDAAGLIGFNSIKGTSKPATGGVGELILDGGLELGLDARAHFSLNDRYVLVPLLRGSTFRWGLTQSPSGSPRSVLEHRADRYEIGAGLTCRWERIMLVAGASFQKLILTREEQPPGIPATTTTSMTDLPKIQFGAEFFLADWCIGRVGYFDRVGFGETESQIRGSVTITESSIELPWYGDPAGLSSAQQRLTLGIGLRFSNFAFDGTVGEGFFLQGPWAISGAAQAVFGVLSIHYRFSP